MEKFIRYKDHIVLYSDDNWKTINALTKSSKDAVEETNSDIAKCVQLRYELGEQKGKIIIDELNSIREQFNLQKNDGFGHAFEVFAIAVLYNIDYDVAYNNYIVTGKEDGKIDAIYWKNDDKNIVYQIKMDFFDLNDLKEIEKNYLSFIKTGTISSKDTSDLLNFCEKHKDNINTNKSFEIITVSNNNSSKTNIKLSTVYNKFFENIIICKENEINLSLSVPYGNGVATSTKSPDIFVYLVDAHTFVSNLLDCESIKKEENLYKYFYDNVRGDLGDNQDISETIEKDPSNFIKYNNGITITGEVEYIKNTTTIKIKNPIINNGQQTIWNLVRKYPNIEDISLLIIVKNETNNKIKAKISRYTNSQRNIKPVDLLSLNHEFRNLQKQLFDLTSSNSGYFLELNSSGTRKYTKILKQMYSKFNIISLTDFCKLYFSTDDLKLGNWKSNVSTKIKELLSKNITFDLDKALMICKIISKYKEYIQNITDNTIKNDLKSSDLAFMFIMYKYNVTETVAHSIIDKINQNNYYSIPKSSRKSKLIDLYKSNNVIDLINQEAKQIGIKIPKEKSKC